MHIQQLIEERHPKTRSPGVTVMEVPLIEAFVDDLDAACRQVATQPR